MTTPNSRDMATPEHSPAYRLADLTQPLGPRRKSKTSLIILVVVLMVVLLATAAGVTYALTRQDGAGAAPPIAGCAEGSTEELFVQRVFECPDGTRVVTFASDQARDDYLKIATHFGAVVIEQGPAWARIRI